MPLADPGPAQEGARQQPLSSYTATPLNQAPPPPLPRNPRKSRVQLALASYLAMASDGRASIVVII